MMMNDSKKILAKSIKLDHWRKQFNKDSFGLGTDLYQPNNLYQYPEAYALWGIGYLKLFQFTNNTKYLQSARLCYEWLLENSLKDSTGISWGLPWEWTRWNVSKGIGYLITTVFVGDFFIDYYKRTNDRRIVEDLEKIAQWIEKENGFGNYKGNIYALYARSPELQWYILNPSAKAAAFFYKLSDITNCIHYRELGQQLTQTILRNQSNDGGWFYGEKSKMKDITHNAFIAESLFDIFLVTRDETLLLPLKKSVDFFTKNLITHTGKCLGRSLLKISDLAEVSLYQVVKDYLAPFRMRFFNFDFESPLWGYSSALRLLTKLSRLDEFDVMPSVDKLLDYIETHLEKADGAFMYKTNDDRVFIRHQAHTFSALNEHLMTITNLH